MILALLQARMSSTRLPGKVLKPLCGRPMVLRQIERLQRCARLGRLVLATSTEPSDDPLAEAVAEAGVAVHRGPLDDVLARFAGALAAHPAEHVVRLTADCPLADPAVVDATVALHLESGADYTSNTPDTFSYPKGQDVEVMTAAALRRVAAEANSREAREHVTWDLYHGDRGYRAAWLASPKADDGDIRWTVDTPDDYAFAEAVYEALYPGNPAFTSDDIRVFVAGRPDLAQFGGHRRL
ncbi:glycosyltransferase family protein [Phenylobacterium sp.]|uniref:glycosyltransferase family protein n=1 Tax=Phenylobacterium sp. TaxID=1871053 RepID=UPI0025D4417B|nr:glycosyltransferase family protein [Phenylobacterium sp.]MBX3485341.1 glycosyltransferase family protein [Phenylobacterium sp.]MCW5759596.1 glycosyltransferase family protein [Phenylobacterium sp.]